MKKLICYLTLFTLLFTALFAAVSCGSPLGEREYLEDLYVDIPDTEYRLLIKEWSYLLGSGEDVYFVASPDEEPVLLGKLTGGDDGYCPFHDGKYAVEYADGAVTLSWSFTGSDTYSRSERFELPVKSE